MRSSLLWLVWSVFAASVLPGIAATNTTTMNVSNCWAWGASTGWINCRPDPTNGAVIGEYACSGYFYSLTTGYIHLGNGQPTNGVDYKNAATNDYGVNHDGLGNLRGFAWSDGIGWIVFEDEGAPHIDLTTGVITGYAWSASMGWIGFSNLYYFARTDRLEGGVDSDSDTIPDAWEMDKTKGLDVLSESGDSDGDGVPDPLEYAAGTDPTNKDSFFCITGFSVTNSTNAILTWTSEQTRQYRILGANALSNGVTWSDSFLGLISVGAGPETTKTLMGVTTNMGFYRIKAIVPLSE